MRLARPNVIMKTLQQIALTAFAATCVIKREIPSNFPPGLIEVLRAELYDIFERKTRMRLYTVSCFEPFSLASKRDDRWMQMWTMSDFDLGPLDTYTDCFQFLNFFQHVSGRTPVPEEKLYYLSATYSTPHYPFYFPFERTTFACECKTKKWRPCECKNVNPRRLPKLCFCCNKKRPLLEDHTRQAMKKK